MAENETFADLRESRRMRTIKKGRIMSADHTSVLDCIIRDLTNKGARLEFGHIYDGKDEFTLQIGYGDNVVARVDCEVRWKRGKTVGVLFAEEVDVAPKIS